MNGADAIVRCLEKEGVKYVFGYPGVAIAPFYDSILESDIHTILVRQEQCAAHAASGYTRITGKTGVVAVTSGPGAENLITGIATAFADSIPMVCLTGQVDSHQVGGDVFQEADISGAVESFVKYSYIVRDAKEIPRVVREAFHIAGTGRPGPVLIDLPCDIQLQEVPKFEYPEKVSMRTYKPTVEGHAVQIRKVTSELLKAKRPILCVGGGVHLSHAQKEVCEFAHRYGIPAVCTMMGLGVFPTEDPMFYGMVGNNGQKYGNRAMNEADMILMVGARVADRSISQPDLITENKVLVHIDVDPAEIGKNAGASIPLVGDIRHVFRKFLEAEPAADYSEWTSRLDVLRTEGKNARLEKHREAEERDLREKNPWVNAASEAVPENGGQCCVSCRCRPEPALELCQCCDSKRKTSHKRRYGNHGLCRSRRYGSKACGSEAPGDCRLRRWRFPDDHDGACHHEAVWHSGKGHCPEESYTWSCPSVPASESGGSLLHCRPRRLSESGDAYQGL